MLQLWQLAHNIPFSLLLTFLVITTNALPAKSALREPLTPENFDKTVSKGLWFVEHFSPYCHHCRQFAPTWEKLVNSNEHPGVEMVQVDCAVNGDLCQEHKVTGYPQMNMYKDGELVEIFKGNREWNKLVEFMKKHADSLTGTQTSSESKVEVATTTKAEDIPPAPTNTLNPDGIVRSLTPDNFQAALNDGPTFIKYFAPWCGHCKKLAPAWKNLAKEMKGKVTVAEVNCETYKSFCSKQGVEGFPALFWYVDGSKTEYTGGRKLEKMKEFAEKATSKPYTMIEADRLDYHITENEVLYALLYSGDSTILNALTPTFSSLLGNPAVVAISKPPSSLYTQYSLTHPLNVLLAFKAHDTKNPTSSLTLPSSPADYKGHELAKISDWMKASRLPTTSELTQDTFQFIMNSPSKPLVVIAPSTEKTASSISYKVENLSKKWRSKTAGRGLANGREVIFTWMDQGKWKDWMKSMYGIKSAHDSADETEVVIVDHQALIYWNVDTSGEKVKLGSSDSVFRAVEGAAHGETTAINSENFFERLARKVNNQFMSIESYIANHPIYTLSMFGMVLVVIFMGMRRALSDDGWEHGRDYQEKGSRLD